LRRQSDLLSEPWNALLVLDAARADVTCARWKRFRKARALGGITHEWCAKLWGICAPLVHLTANPVVTYEWLRTVPRPEGVTVADIWRERWQEFGEHGVGSVHPDAVNTYVHKWLAEHGRPERLVVHYLQPHAPYIGKHMLPFKGGNIVQGPSSRNDMAVPEAIRRGVMSWADLRRCYEDNLALAMPYALQLAEQLRGRVIVTSDHGEALGEGDRYGHAGVHWPELWEVPWWEVTT
jgi:hypothetical protein